MNVHPDQARWDAKYAGDPYTLGTEPVPFLVEHLDALPAGRALVLAAGEGRNAVYLAQQGFTVDGVDISPVGLAKAARLAAERGVQIRTITANLETWDPGTARYDVVTNFYYLQRDLTQRIIRALKPGGVVVYQTFTVEQLELPGAHVKRRDYLLERGELSRRFASLEVLHYGEVEGVASLVARKPGPPAPEMARK